MRYRVTAVERKTGHRRTLPVEARDERAAGWAVAERGLEVLAIEPDATAPPRPAVPLGPALPPGIDPSPEGLAELRPLRLAARYTRVLGTFLLILACFYAFGVWMSGALNTTASGILLTVLGVVMFVLPTVLCFAFAMAADEFKRWSFIALLCLAGLLTLVFGVSVVGQIVGGAESVPGIIMAAIVVLLSVAIIVQSARALGVLAWAGQRSAPAFEVRPRDVRSGTGSA